MTKAQEQERQYQAFKKLGFTDEEIAEIRQADKDIDQDKASLKSDQDTKDLRMAHVYNKPKVPVKRVRQPNCDKQHIINDIVDLFKFNNPVVVNKEKEILIEYNDNQYKIVLSKPRKN